MGATKTSDARLGGSRVVKQMREEACAIWTCVGLFGHGLRRSARQLSGWLAGRLAEPPSGVGCSQPLDAARGGSGCTQKLRDAAGAQAHKRPAHGALVSASRTPCAGTTREEVARCQVALSLASSPISAEPALSFPRPGLFLFRLTLQLGPCTQLAGRLACLPDSKQAPLAQLDRASVSGTEGHWFESSVARQPAGLIFTRPCRAPAPFRTLWRRAAFRGSGRRPGAS